MSSFVATHVMTITPSDVSPLANPVNMLLINGAGTIKVQAAHDSSPVTFTVPAGLVLELRVTQVYATGTTATNIVGFW